MGLEDTWAEYSRTDEDELTRPPPDFPIALPPPPSILSDLEEASPYPDSSLDNGPFSDELECLFSTVNPSSSPDDPLVEPGKGEPGVCGLKNLGNTCFMSAGVQCLMSTAPLTYSLLTQAPSLPSHCTLTLELAQLTRRMWSGQYSSIQPSQFKTALGSHYPQFNDNRQNDCQEFLALLLDGLHEQMNTSISKDFSCQVEPLEINKDQKCASTSTGFTGSVLNGFKHDPSTQKATPIKSNKNFNVDTPSECSIDRKSVDESKSDDKCNVTRRDVVMNNSNLDATRPSDICVLKNAVGRLSGLDDILKDAKTPNVNVLVQKHEANNEIRFDSQKYPRIDNIKRNETFSYNPLHTSSSNGKRYKTPEGERVSESEIKDGLALKRVKLEEDGECSNGGRSDKNRRLELERMEDKDTFRYVEKNVRMECERKKQLSLEGSGEGTTEEEQITEEVAWASSDQPSGSGGSGEDCDMEAEKHWQQHLSTNQSVIVSTFQGQFKSTVVCSTCQFISVTYEPFMYLSVPLPNAMKTQICVTYIGQSMQPVKLMVEMNKRESVKLLKEKVLAIVDREPESLVIGEVFDNHIAKRLDDSCLIRSITSSCRSVYAFEVVTLTEEVSNSVKEVENGLEEPSTSTESSKNEEVLLELSCTICLEDKELNMKQHIGCTCLLCDACVTRSCQHYKSESLACPVCRVVVDPEKDFVPIKPSSEVSVRMISLPVVYRLDVEGDGNNNKKTIELFGHPSLVRLPNHCSLEWLHKALESVIPYSPPYQIRVVDGQGRNCSRCMYHSHCRGCLPGNQDGRVTLYASDTLAVCFSCPVEPVPTQKHPSLEGLRSNHPLTLYDCIHAFSQSEVLDEHNPWYCPRCKKNQCATKTLTVWRYPDYLIVYLKRFVFHDQISTKLEEKVVFPLQGLKLSRSSVYDLYSCVCHIGDVYVGHYTTYTLHPYTGEWHYFNDSLVTKQAPLEEDYSNAYILFYKKQGIHDPVLETEKDCTTLSNIG